MKPENKDGPAELWVNGICVGRTRSAIFEQDHQTIQSGDMKYMAVVARRIKLVFGQYDIDLAKLAEAIKAGPQDNRLPQGHFLPCAESDVLDGDVVEVKDAPVKDAPAALPPAKTRKRKVEG